MQRLISIMIAFLGAIIVSAQETQLNRTRSSKALYVWNIVQFPNMPCGGTTSRNGTCYTSDECLKRFGTASGSCANGFGVCCIISLQCGQTSSDNCTYLVQSTTSTPSQSNCIYKICKCNPNICRIRLDFTTFDITGPVSGMTKATGVAGVSTSGGAIGDCAFDTFSFQSPGNKASPIICGFNTGQHVYMDASDMCSTITFTFGSNSKSRQYDIKVNQYLCGDQRAGPPDCLQYFTSDTGTVKSFNYQTTNGAVTSTATHLSSQCYEICFRRNPNKCALCFFPTITSGTSEMIQNSFGLSITGTGAPANSGVETSCSNDYLVIPGSVNTAAIALAANTNAVVSRLCGRFFNTDLTPTNAPSSACTGTRPFKIIFKTDSDEVTTMPSNDASVNEEAMFPGGIIGFSLDYTQVTCL